MDLSGKRLLLVGGAGLIGSHTLDELLKEEVAELVIFDNFSRGCKENIAGQITDPRVKIFDFGGDVLHTDMLDAAMQNIDGVFHFAALWLLHCYEYPRAAFEVNITGTFNVLEACIRNGVKRLVFSSSASVYGDALVNPMTEEHPYNNNTFYGATKIAGEHMCRSLYHRYKGSAKEFSYVGLRYMNVYGPRQDYHGTYVSVIMKMLDRIEKGLPPIVFGDGSQAYDFVYVGDCGRANVCAMQSGETDNFYNVGTGIQTTIKELALLLLDITGSDLEIQYEPAGLSFVTNRIGCTKKATDDLHFKASVNLKEGLLKLIEWRNAQKNDLGRKRSDSGAQVD